MSGLTQHQHANFVHSRLTAETFDLQKQLRKMRSQLLESSTDGPAPEGRDPVGHDRLGWRCDKCGYRNGAFKGGKFEWLDQEKRCRNPKGMDPCGHVFDLGCCRIVTVEAEERKEDEGANVQPDSGPEEVVDGGEV